MLVLSAMPITTNCETQFLPDMSIIRICVRAGSLYLVSELARTSHNFLLTLVSQVISLHQL